MTSNANDEPANSDMHDLRCDVLLLFATSSEKKMLKKTALDLGFKFSKCEAIGRSGDVEKFYSLGMVGNSRVNAIRTEMGPFSYGGSASRAIYYRTITGATAMIQIGMAFGVDPKLQRLGDVLVATSLIPYDLRVVRAATAKAIEYPKDMLGFDPSRPEAELESLASLVSETSLSDMPAADRQSEALKSEAIALDDSYVTDYSPAVRHRPKKALLRMFEAESDETKHEYSVFFGGLLTGGARVFSRKFVAELMRGVPQADDGIVGGEMEGAGLLSVSPIDDPVWGVVKGISDFGDEDRDQHISRSRPLACENAARFVLGALMRAGKYTERNEGKRDEAQSAV